MSMLTLEAREAIAQQALALAAGKYAVCMHGRIGIVRDVKTTIEGGLIYCGTRVFGGGRWESRQPRWLSQVEQASLAVLQAAQKQDQDKDKVC